MKNTLAQANSFTPNINTFGQRWRDKAGLNSIVPDYMVKHYYWAYLNPRNVRLLDRAIVVNIILWGNDRKLRRAAFSELEAGQNVLQAGHVYGPFCPELAEHLGPEGRLSVIDVTPVQVARCNEKLSRFNNAAARRMDAAGIDNGAPYDSVCCFFLLHEVPLDKKRKIIDRLLAGVEPGGKVIFVDYHKPHWTNPLRYLMRLVFDMFEPFAKELWQQDIRDLATNSKAYSWKKELFFGGLYQKVVAVRND